jgi:hypothetical protein
VILHQPNEEPPIASEQSQVVVARIFRIELFSEVSLGLLATDYTADNLIHLGKAIAKRRTRGGKCTYPPAGDISREFRETPSAGADDIIQ